MRTFTIYTIVAFLFLSCQHNSDNKITNNNDSISIRTNDSKPIDSSLALRFINDYVAYLNLEKQSVHLVSWVENNSYVTESFKTELKRIIDQAKKDDPEMGLGFDPILDAQDYPSEGFVVENIDEKTGYINVAGKNWNDFKLRIKVVKVKERWLVDGSGIINIEENLIIKENKVAVDDEEQNFILSDKDEKIYDMYLYLEKKIASGEIGSNPILQVDLQPVPYIKNQLVEKLSTFRITQIKIISRELSTAVFGKTGADGIVQIQTK